MTFIPDSPDPEEERLRRWRLILGSGVPCSLSAHDSRKDNVLSQLYGKKDERGFEVAENKIGIPDFNATIAYALGLPLDQVLYSPSKRPFTVADKGQPITALFG